MRIFVFPTLLVLSACATSPAIKSGLNNVPVAELCAKNLTYKKEVERAYVRSALQCVIPGCMNLLSECDQVNTLEGARALIKNSKAMRERKRLALKEARTEKIYELVSAKSRQRVCENIFFFDGDYLVRKGAKDLIKERGINCDKSFALLKKKEREEKTRKETARLEGLSPNKLCDLYSTNAQANKIAEKQGLGPFCRAYLSEKALQDERRNVVAEQNRRKQLIEACEELVNSGLIYRSKRRDAVRRLGGSEAECKMMFPEPKVIVKERTIYQPRELPSITIPEPYKSPCIFNCGKDDY